MTNPMLIRGRLYMVDGQPMKYLGNNWEYGCHEFMNLETLTSVYWDPDDDESIPPCIIPIPTGTQFTVVYTQAPEV